MTHPDIPLLVAAEAEANGGKSLNLRRRSLRKDGENIFQMSAQRTRERFLHIWLQKRAESPLEGGAPVRGRCKTAAELNT